MSKSGGKKFPYTKKGRIAAKENQRIKTKVSFKEELEVRNPKVSKLDLDFGREDLNKLKDKVNELAELS